MAEAKSDDRLVFDCLSAVLLLLVAVLGAYMPKYLASKGSLQQGTASSLAFHLGNMLSGGVMLSAGFCHLLADALRQLAFLGRFPIAPFLAAVGYLITLLADQIVQLLTTDADGPGLEGGGGCGGGSHGPSPMPPGGGPAYDNSLQDIERRGSGFSTQARYTPEPSPAAVSAAAPAGGLGGFLRGGIMGGHHNSKAWGYSRLEDRHQEQDSSDCHAMDVELIPSNGTILNSSSSTSPGLAAAGAAAGALTGAVAAVDGALSPPAAAAAGAAGHNCGSSCPNGGLIHQLSSAAATPAQGSCCHNPASCPCCLARSIGVDAAGEGLSGLNALNPGPGGSSSSTQGPPPPGFVRRPGSAGGLARAGLGLGSVARTRSLASPSGALLVPGLSPLQAAAATELVGGLSQRHGSADAAAVISSSVLSGAAAGAAAGGPLLSSGGPYPAAEAAVGGGAPAGGAGGGVAAGGPRPLQVSTGGGLNATSEQPGDDALCLLAAGSPRSVSAGGLHPRSPKVRPASALTQHHYHHQQQQQQHLSQANGRAEQHEQQCNGHHQQQQQVQSPGVLGLQQQHLQQLQQQQPAADLMQRANSSSIGQLLLQPVRQQQQQQPQQLSLPGCMCCCQGAAARSPAMPSAQPDMTEACTVARVAGHLDLEVMSTTTGGGHNHAHFQVFLSHRPLSFATSLLLACALCIHSILEGLALGAQQSMQATEDIMLAIAAHKGLAAYALGASIVESGASDSKFWVVVGLFAAATPLGIAIGYASSVLGHGPVSAAMSALASGTFLYVALNEVIPKELEHPDGHRLAKVAALLLGFGLMSLLAVWA